MFRFDKIYSLKNKIITGLLVLAIFSGQLSFAANDQIFAASAEDKKHQAEQDLHQVQNEIKDLENKSDEASEEKEKILSELDTIFAEQGDLQGKISAKQLEIDGCQFEISVAELELQEQSKLMKTRIQFMYENSGADSILGILFNSKGIVDMLKKYEYISNVYKKDRALIKNYEDKVAEIKEKEATLNEELEEFVALQDEYELKQLIIRSKIAKIYDLKDQYQKKIDRAEEMAAEYERIIAVQGKIIRAQEAAAAAANADTYEGGGTGEAGLSADVAYLYDISKNPAPKTDVSGQDIVDFALQFVGRPYRWGGNDLVNGVDCSGFVHQVYAHFGISTPRYSQAFKNYGEPVAYANIQPGDVIVFPGHVAIAIGNGYIVEAQSTKTGITSDRVLKCHKVTAIRRYV